MKIEESLSTEPCYFPTVADINLENIPQDVLDRLQAIANEEGCSINDIIVFAIERYFARYEHTKHLDELFAHPTGLRSTKRERRAFIAELRRERDAI